MNPTALNAKYKNRSKFMRMKIDQVIIQVIIHQEILIIEHQILIQTEMVLHQIATVQMILDQITKMKHHQIQQIHLMKINQEIILILINQEMVLLTMEQILMINDGKKKMKLYNPHQLQNNQQTPRQDRPTTHPTNQPTNQPNEGNNGS